MSLIANFQCNDPGTGDFAGAFEDLEILHPDWGTLRLLGPEIKLHHSHTQFLLRVGDREFAYESWHPWYGNRSWDGFDLVDLFGLLMFLHDRGWDVETAESHLFNAWRETRPEEALKAALRFELEYWFPPHHHTPRRR